MLTRQQITAICIRHMTAAMQIASDKTIAPSDEAKHLYEVIANMANDLDRTLDDAKEVEAKQPQAISTTCGTIGCTNISTHCWSGHPTCDDCATPTRKANRSQPH